MSTTAESRLLAFTYFVLDVIRRRVVLLGILILQNTLAAVVGRYTRSNRAKEDLYDIGHFLLICELGKLVLSLVLEVVREKTIQRKTENELDEAAKHKLLQGVRLHMWQRPWETLRVAPVAVLYFWSNSLRYLAQGHLDVPLFQVIVQSRLVTTAAWSVLLLKKTYGFHQWVCLITTTVGVVLVVLGETWNSHRHNHQSLHVGRDHLWLGLFALGTACVLSSLASVYFEKILKLEQEKTTQNKFYQQDGVNTGSTMTTSSTGASASSSSMLAPSLWIRNIQLALFSILVATLHGTGWHQQPEQRRPFFHGFDTWVWVQAILFSVGGILVAAVTKYADSVLKGLATTLSMLLSSSLSTVLFSSASSLRSMSFGLGAIIIVTSVYMYSNPLPAWLLSWRCAQLAAPQAETKHRILRAEEA